MAAKASTKQTVGFHLATSNTLQRDAITENKFAKASKCLFTNHTKISQSYGSLEAWHKINKKAEVVWVGHTASLPSMDWEKIT